MNDHQCLNMNILTSAAEGRPVLSQSISPNNNKRRQQNTLMKHMNMNSANILSRKFKIRMLHLLGMILSVQKIEQIGTVASKNMFYRPRRKLINCIFIAFTLILTVCFSCMCVCVRACMIFMCACLCVFVPVCLCTHVRV